MFCSRVGLSGSADRMALFLVTSNQWSNYSIIYEGPENMASDSEPRKNFFEAPSEVMII